MYCGRIKKIHFVGIGGSGMCGIAEVLLNTGYKVSGSDKKLSEVTKRLEALGAEVYSGHVGANVKGVDCVVYSSAVKGDNPELVEAGRRQIPTIARAEMLAELMHMKYGVLVAGTHGKTTTTSMVASILAEGGIDPTVVTGGKLNAYGSNAKLGKGEFIVAEADESDGSFLKLSPTIAVVTNIDREHMDHYKDMDDLKGAFLDFMNKVPFYGCTVLCLDHPVIQELLPSLERRYISFGLSTQADVHAEGIEHSDGSTSFTLMSFGKRLGQVRLNMPGVHNILNALASIAVAIELGIDVSDIIKALGEFKGVERRFQVKTKSGSSVMVVDDYGHHPVEIKAVLKAVKDGFSGRRVMAVFQPHRYSRTEELFSDFTGAFNDADELIITSIYAAGEEPIVGVDSEDLCRAIEKHGHRNVTFVKDMDAIIEALKERMKDGDIVITFGAGDIWKVADAVAESLN